MRVLINGLSMGGGGGLTVGRHLTESLAAAHPDWRIELEVTAQNPLHEELDGVVFPANASVRKAPRDTQGRRARSAYERGPLAARAEADGVDVVLQLNGMVVAGMKPPTVSHFQDPWPYRREAWGRPLDRWVAVLKRRAHRYALRRCAAATWTSSYLEQLICGHAGRTPAISEVVYNGVPDNWLDRPESECLDWAERPRILTTVSNVTEYKRQSLVIRSLGKLHERGELRDVEYRVGGQGTPAVMDGLRTLAEECGVGDRVFLEGRISDERVRELFRTSRVFVLMSVCESFGIPAVEAMTFATPVVVADCCAIPEVCGDAGAVVPVDDVNALADRLLAVFESEAEARAMGTRGRTRAQQFSWRAVAERMGGVLERAAVVRAKG